MGSKKSKAEIGYIDKRGNFVQVKDILDIEFPERGRILMDVVWEGGTWSARFRLHHPRTRKRFVKYLMGHGYSRNEANEVAESYHRHGYTWGQALLDIALWSA